MSENENYWKSVALWMGDVIAATASRQVSLKGVGSGEKNRQMRIAAQAADALEGRNCPTPRKLEVILERLRAVPSDATT